MFFAFYTGSYKQAMGKVNNEEDFILNQSIKQSKTISEKLKKYNEQVDSKNNKLVNEILNIKSDQYVWGIVESKQNKETWKNLKYDDVIYFISNNTIKYIGIVEEILDEKYSSVSNELSDILFNQSTENKTKWNCIYFLKKVYQTEIPLYLLNRFLGYDDNAVPRSLQIMKNDSDAQKTLFRFLISLTKGEN